MINFAKLETEGEAVEGVGRVFYKAGTAEEQIEHFAKSGIPAPYFADTRDMVNLRLARKEDANEIYGRTSIVPVTARRELTVLSRESGPVLIPGMAWVVQELHRQGKYFDSLPRGFYDILRERAEAEEKQGKEPEDRMYMVLAETGDHVLKKDSPQARFVGGVNSGKYLTEFGHADGFKVWDLSSEDLAEDKCRVNYLWSGGPAVGSRLYLGGGDLCGGGSAFGVLCGTAEGSSQKFLRAHLTRTKNAVVKAVKREFTDSELGESLADRVGKSVVDDLRLQ